MPLERMTDQELETAGARTAETGEPLGAGDRDAAAAERKQRGADPEPAGELLVDAELDLLRPGEGEVGIAELVVEIARGGQLVVETRARAEVQIRPRLPVQQQARVDRMSAGVDDEVGVGTNAGNDADGRGGAPARLRPERRGDVQEGPPGDHPLGLGGAEGAALPGEGKVEARPVVAEDAVESERQAQCRVRSAAQIFAQVEAVVADVAAVAGGGESIVAVAVSRLQAGQPGTQRARPGQQRAVEAHVAAELDALVGVGADHLEVVVGAEGEKGEATTAGGKVVDPGLVVPVRGDGGVEGRSRLLGHQGGKDEIDGAAPGSHRDRGAGSHRRFDEERSIERAQLGGTVQLAGDGRLPAADVDDSRGDPAVADAETARKKVDVPDQVRGDDGWTDQEVVERGQGEAVEENAGVDRGGAPHHQQARGHREGGRRRAGSAPRAAGLPWFRRPSAPRRGPARDGAARRPGPGARRQSRRWGR